MEQQKVLIYGAGDFFAKNKDAIKERYVIEAIIDQNKDGILDGYNIIKIKQCADYSYDKILIMVADIKICFEIITALLENGVLCEKIILGNSLFGEYVGKYDSIKILPDGKMRVSKNGIDVSVGCLDEFNNTYEVLIEECYNYQINNSNKDVVIDVGMNVGDATLYFLANTKVEKVYAYEPFLKTFMDANWNLAKYINSDRLEIFQYGWGGVTEEREIIYNKDITCGLSTQKAENMNGYDVYEFYYDNNFAERKKEEVAKVMVKNAADELRPILNKYKKTNNIVLKMDCEGEEYGIVKLLNHEKLLSQIDFIMLEWHYCGKEQIVNELEKAGFSYLCTEQREETGQLCAWHNNK